MNCITVASLAAGDFNQAMADVQSVWTEFYPDAPFVYFFREEDFEQQYHLETRINRLL